MKARNSNHELLRLISMYMIILIHANMYLGSFYTGDLWHAFNGMVNGICNIGVTCFILISGYYGVKFDFHKLVKLECMMISYSLLETGILYFLLPGQMQGTVLLEQLVKSLLPFLSRKYWFYSCYVCLILFSGYIEKLIENLSQEEFKRLLILSFCLFSVLPTFFYFEIVPDNGKGLVQMIMVYMIGRYIRKYRDVTIPGKRAAALLVLLWIINGVSHEFPIELGGIYHHLCKDNSFTNLIMAVLLFYLFKGISFQSAFLNKAASYIFAVFALNNTLVTVIMTLLKDHGMQGGSSMVGVLELMGMVLVILVGCLVIGFIREVILGKADKRVADWGMKLINKIVMLLRI